LLLCLAEVPGAKYLLNESTDVLPMVLRIGGCVGAVLGLVLGIARAAQQQSDAPNAATLG
jgi:hypothetical protein